MKSLIVITLSLTAAAAVVWFKPEPKTYSTTVTIEFPTEEAQAIEHCNKCGLGAFLQDPGTSKIRCSYCGENK